MQLAHAQTVAAAPPAAAHLQTLLAPWLSSSWLAAARGQWLHKHDVNNK
jgi:hypothetical protein